MSSTANRQQGTLTLEQRIALSSALSPFIADPLGFVMYAYPWDTDPAIQLVRLPSPWRERYGCDYGPDGWACELLDEIGQEVQKRNFDGVNAVAPLRVAVSSGHGPGKSTLSAWLVDWIMSTRPGSHGSVTANTVPQLQAKTWAQVARWTKKCITAPLFRVTTGRGAMRMEAIEDPENWRVDAVANVPKNSESFAGQHAAGATSFYLFDEASAIEDVIWEVSEGGLLIGEPMMFAFGNPTKNRGRFHGAFYRLSHRWVTRTIDSREAQLTNKSAIAELIEDFGEDSDIVKVRVRGLFPSSSSEQFISSLVIDAAEKRQVEVSPTEVIIVGVDVARLGPDRSVIATRIGYDGRSIPPKTYEKNLTDDLVQYVVDHVNEIRMRFGRLPDRIFVDVGYNPGVFDGIKAIYGPEMVIPVDFGGKSSDPKRWKNKRAEIYDRLRTWLKQAAIPADPELRTDLEGIEYHPVAGDSRIIQLVSKEQAKKVLGLPSPDISDAYAVTFAQPVRPLDLERMPEQRRGDTSRRWREYAPTKAKQRAMTRRGVPYRTE